MGLTCELCGGTDFVKSEGLFVCQGCGCKYTVEEARKVMAQAAQEQQQRHERQQAYHRRHDPDLQSRQQTPVSQTPVASGSDGSYLPLNPQVAADFPQVAADFSQVIGGGLQGPQAINNYACQGWQLLLDEYGRLEHPSKQRQAELGERAREVLALLDNAARLEPENHVQDLLILENCKEVASSAHQTKYYDQDDEGKWRSHSFGLTVNLPGQSSSWDEMIKFHRSFLEQRYRDGHPGEVSEREALVAQREEIEGRLAQLKDEKRSKGLFNFSEKREVKDRMKPLQAELAEVNRQISALDANVSNYVKARVKELESGYIRLNL